MNKNTMTAMTMAAVMMLTATAALADESVDVRFKGNPASGLEWSGTAGTGADVDNGSRDVMDNRIYGPKSEYSTNAVEIAPKANRVSKPLASRLVEFNFCDMGPLSIFLPGCAY